MEEPSPAPASAADLLREAAKKTMIRKQATVSKQPSTATLRNGASSNNASPGRPSSNPLPAKPLPRGPRGSDVSNGIPLNYGDPSESSILDSYNPLVGTKPSGTPRQSLAQRISVRARTESEDMPEEGEISDEEIRENPRPEESANAPVKQEPMPASAGISTAPITASKSASESTNDTNGEAIAQGASTKLNQAQSAAAQSAFVIPPVSKRSSISGAMQPPRPPTNVHREPAPISPTASAPLTHSQSSARKLRPDHSFPNKQLAMDHPAPSPNTHSFDDLNQMTSIDTATLDRSENGDEDHWMDEISPKTTQLNQEVFTQLLRLGVDDDHCRPGLPMKFSQFNDAKQLILDLLGFGMTPENIAEIGVDRRLLVYCLRELKIRLPSNVPVDDIVLFDPPLNSSTELGGQANKDDSEDSFEVKSPQTPPNHLLSPNSIESSLVDALIVENISESPPATPPSPPVNTNLIIPSLPPTSSSLPLPPSKLNVNAEPFLPAKPPPQTTGPSLFAMALPSQQISPMPTHEPSIASLPPRPSFSFDAASSRRSTAGSSSAGTTIPAAPTQADTEMAPPQQISEHLLRLEQEKRALLLRQKLLERKGANVSQRRDSGPPPAAIAKPVLDTELQHKSSILEGENVGSPMAIDLDEPILRSSSAPNIELAPHNPTPSVVMPKRPPVQLRATLARALTMSETSRPTTPSENGPKRGVKRPKADDFVEENQPAKKSARLNGVPNFPPLKRSSFAIANSVPPEQLIITWIDDENVDTPSSATWNQQKDPSSANGAQDAEAAQVAAAAMALGLPMTAEELEAARLQEEERKAQLNAKAAKLHQLEATLKRLELKKAEKKLLTLQSMNAHPVASKEALDARNVVNTLKQQLEVIEAKLTITQPVPINKESPYVETATDPSTPEQIVSQEQTADLQLLDAPIDPSPPALSSPENEDWDMLKDDDLDIIISDSPTEAVADRPWTEEQEESDAAHDIPLHHEAASQSRLTPYSPPLILSVLTGRPSSGNQLNYSNADHEGLQTTDPSMNRAQHNLSFSRTPFDPKRMLCQFESVGGICRDSNCQDLHFKDFPA